VQGNLKLFPKVELFITEDFRVYLMEVGKETWRSENTLSAGFFEAIKHLKKQITCLDRESLNSADGPKVGRSSDCLPMKTLAAYTHH
jgi:hypothetical protein